MALIENAGSPPAPVRLSRLSSPGALWVLPGSRGRIAPRRRAAGHGHAAGIRRAVASLPHLGPQPHDCAAHPAGVRGDAAWWAADYGQPVSGGRTPGRPEPRRQRPVPRPRAAAPAARAARCAGGVRPAARPAPLPRVPRPQDGQAANSVTGTRGGGGHAPYTGVGFVGASRSGTAPGADAHAPLFKNSDPATNGPRNSNQSNRWLEVAH